MCFPPATMACTFSTSPTSKSALKPVIFYTFDFDMCFAPQRHALFRQRNFYKCSKAAVALYILTSTCASRHNGVRFFDSATSKSGPNLVCFVPFDFDMCFAPQQRALFATSKSAPELRCFVHFDFEMRFAPQRRALFHLSPGQLAPHPPLSEPTFRPSRVTNHWKNIVFRDFPTFSRTWIFFLLRLSLSSSLLFSDSSHLCFSSVHIVGSLTSKLPSTILYYIICDYYTITTSSTAQGGGGSFKNRKPIGEVGGCE